MSTTLTVQAGEPYSRRIRVTDGTDIWPDLDDFEVRCQVRSGTSERYSLLDDLTPFLTPDIDGDDIVIDLAMTGADTRAAKSGYYDLILSDIGETDVRAIRILDGRFEVEPVITSAGD